MVRIGEGGCLLEDDTYLSYVIMYNSSLFFHTSIPLEMEDKLEIISEGDMDLLFIKYRHNKYVIYAESENLLRERVVNAFKFILNQAVVERNVIIVYVNNRIGSCGAFYNHEHTPIDSVGILYGIEKRIGDSKKYYGPVCEGDNVIFHQEAYIGVPCNIIDDTPENREYVELMYSKIKELVLEVKKATTIAN